MANERITPSKLQSLVDHLNELLKEQGDSRQLILSRRYNYWALDYSFPYDGRLAENTFRTGMSAQEVMATINGIGFGLDKNYRK